MIIRLWKWPLKKQEKIWIENIKYRINGGSWVSKGTTSSFNITTSGNAKVEVDYTFVKNIRKTNDLKPGMVIYDTYETAYIAADPQVIEKLESTRR